MIRWLFHELVLRHGAMRIEMGPDATYKHGRLITCDCGMRWIARDPISRHDGH